MISIVIPVYNEEAIITDLFQRTMAAIATISDDFEIICVNDGSRDQTLNRLIICHQKDNRFKVIDLSRNFGHQAAVLAGLSHAKGDYIGVMDGDLQDPPEVFKGFFEKMQEGYDVVYAVRKKRKEGFLKKAAYWLFYRILTGIADVKIPVDSGDFALMRRCVLDELLRIPEQSLYIRGLRYWVGFRQIGMEYERDSRQAGEAKYNFKMLLRLAYNGIFSFSDFPIRLLGRIGYYTILLSILYIIYLFYKRWVWGEVPQGFTTLIIAIVFFGGVQLVSIRILGEYISRIYNETRNRPLFIVRDVFL